MPHAAALDLWASLPGLMDLVPFKSLFTFANTVLDGQVFYLFLSNQLQVQAFVYTGITIALTMCLVSAAYVATKTVEAAINWTNAAIVEYAHKYRGGSTAWGNNLGIFELVGILLFSGWSLALTILAIMGADQLWSMVEAREKGAKTEGKFGEAFDIVQAIKFFTLCIIVGTTTVIGAYSLGDTANELITWFDQYADDTKSEGDEKKDPSKVDPNGTSAKYDIIYHYVTLAMGYILFSMITFGGHAFAMEFMQYPDTFECDMNLFDSATKDEMRKFLSEFTTLEKCYINMPKVMALADLNKNGNIDRCEDANVLMVMAPNTEKYAMSYSHNQPLITAHQRCEELFNPLF